MEKDQEPKYCPIIDRSCDHPDRCDIGRCLDLDQNPRLQNQGGTTLDASQRTGQIDADGYSTSSGNEAQYRVS